MVPFLSNGFTLEPQAWSVAILFKGATDRQNVARPPEAHSWKGHSIALSVDAGAGEGLSTGVVDAVILPRTAYTLE